MPQFEVWQRCQDVCSSHTSPRHSAPQAPQHAQHGICGDGGTGRASLSGSKKATASSAQHAVGTVPGNDKPGTVAEPPISPGGTLPTAPTFRGVLFNFGARATGQSAPAGPTSRPLRLRMNLSSSSAIDRTPPAITKPPPTTMAVANHALSLTISSVMAQSNPSRQ